ncbi:hypothetical protein FRC20_003801 [Serendipita sp. 405]|nr:hypothetical protein FRC18_012198 [Serendipita sp. 400]KAG8879042.1 hypothetical protein FRC20_003801 [Serendipita sp. 405]
MSKKGMSTVQVNEAESPSSSPMAEKQEYIGYTDIPSSWAGRKKLRVLIPTCAFYFLFTFLTTVTVPTFQQLQEVYKASYAQINYSVAIPALSLAISPLFWTPFADIYGRRIVCIAGCALAFGASIGSALVKTYAGYMVLRFLQGWGAGPASTVGLQMLQDIYSELERGEKIGYWTAAIDLGLLFGPLLGGFAAIPSYVWPAWLTAILFGILLISITTLMPETAHSAYIDGFSTSFLNFKSIPRSQKTRLWTTTVNCFRMFAYPRVCLPVMFYCWTWSVTLNDLCRSID